MYGLGQADRALYNLGQADYDVFKYYTWHGGSTLTICVLSLSVAVPEHMS